MGHAYTPGLTVSAHTVIVRRRILPIKGKVLVREGQHVSAEEVVARTFLPGGVTPVNIAQKLGVPPEEVPSCMTAAEGAEVEEGGVIARVKTFFGLFTSEVKSPASGVIESVSPRTGQVMIRQKPTALQLRAYLEGEVSKVFPGEGVEIRTSGSWIQGIFGIGGEKRGVIKLAVEDPSEELRPESIGAEAEGVVLVGGAFATAEAYRRAAEAGAAGLVVGGFDDEDLRAILGYDLGVAVTGEEAVPTTLILTEGFGRIPMARKTFELLRGLEGCAASINGATQIRAGVVRPEIIVSRPGEAGPQEAPERRSGALEVGSAVRIIREPYFGLLGRVSALPTQPTRIETGARVRVVQVRLENGSEVTVPRANVEVLEEH